MIDEELLRIAASEANDALVNALPAPEDCEHKYSPLFHKKMRKLLRRAKHPVLYQLSKKAACLALAATLFSGAWLTIDAEARSHFFLWIKEQYASFVEYRFVGDAPTDTIQPRYHMTWIPDGFTLTNEQTAEGTTLLVYHNNEQRITLSFVGGSDAVSLFVASDFDEVRSVKIGSISADLYCSSKTSSANALVWVSEDNTTAFCIMADQPEDIMVRMAESVQRMEKKFFLK